MLIAVVCLLISVACNTGATPAETTPTAEPTERPLSSYDFEDVCRRGTVERAPVYNPEVETGAIHPIVIFKRNSADDSYSSMLPSTLELPVPWTVDIGDDHGAVELVVCLTGIDSSLADECSYEDDESDDEYILNIYDTTYEVKIYTAHTGEEIASTTVKAQYETCPMIHLFSEKVEDAYASPPSASLEEFLQPYVEP
jgi:hypothetical protein